jgi:hypothetical protein
MTKAAKSRVLPTHVYPERMDVCSNRAPKNIFFDVGSNRGDVLHAFLYKKHLNNSNNPDWKFLLLIKNTQKEK